MRRHITIENKRILITIWQRTFIVQFTVYENDIMSLSETQQKSYNCKIILSNKIKHTDQMRERKKRPKKEED